MKIDITTSNYFEGFFLVLGYVMIPIAVYLIAVDYILPGVIVGIIAFVIITTRYKLMVDRDEGVYKEYLWIGGFENGTRKSFNQIGVVAVKPERYVQRINSVVANKEMRFTVYAVYVYADGEELFAGESKEKEKADELAKKLSKDLGTSYYL